MEKRKIGKIVRTRFRTRDLWILDTALYQLRQTSAANSLPSTRGDDGTPLQCHHNFLLTLFSTAALWQHSKDYLSRGRSRVSSTIQYPKKAWSFVNNSLSPSLSRHVVTVFQTQQPSYWDSLSSLASIIAQSTVFLSRGRSFVALAFHNRKGPSLVQECTRRSLEIIFLAVFTLALAHLVRMTCASSQRTIIRAPSPLPQGCAQLFFKRRVPPSIQG